MKQEDFLEKTPFGTIIDIDTNISGTERYSNDLQIFNNKDNKPDFIVIQVYKNNCKTMIKLSNITIKISVLN